MLTEDAKRLGIHSSQKVGKILSVSKDIGEEVAIRKEALGMYTMHVLKDAATAVNVEFKTNMNKEDLVSHLAGTTTNEQYENLVNAAQSMTDGGEETEEE